MLKDFDPHVSVSAAAMEDASEIRISSADGPQNGSHLEEAQAVAGTFGLPKHFRSRVARIGPAIVAYSAAGVAGWLLYGLVAPHYAGWSDFFAAKFAQMSAAPVDLLPATQKMAAEIQALQAKVEALEKARNADAKSAVSLEELNRRINDAKAETNAGISALSSQFLLFQQEANAKFAEISAARPAGKRDLEPAESKSASHAVENGRITDAKPAPSLEELNRRFDDAKVETKAEIGALSSQFLLFQQEMNTKFAELGTARPAGKRDVEPVESKVASHAVERGRRHARRRRDDAFDPSLHPTAPGAPKPLGASLDR